MSGSRRKSLRKSNVLLFVCFVLFCCYTTNYHKILCLKTTIISYYLTVSLDQELWSSFAGLLWLRVSHEVAVRCWLGDCLLKIRLAWRLCFQDLSDTWLMVGGLSSSSLGFSTRRLEWPQDMALVSTRANDPTGQIGSCDSFYNLASDNTHDPIHSVLLTSLN